MKTDFGFLYGFWIPMKFLHVNFSGTRIVCVATHSVQAMPKRTKSTRPKTLVKRRKKSQNHAESDSSPDPNEMSKQKAPPRYGGASTNQSGHSDKKLMRYLTCAMFHEILFRTNTYPMSVPKCRALNHHRYWKSMSFLGVPFHMYLGQKTQKMVNKVVRRGIDDLFLLDQVQSI